jgi:hypothetical protein
MLGAAPCQCFSFGAKNTVTKRMGVPGGARARFEAHPGRAQERRRRRLDDRILPDRAGEIIRRRLARRRRAE